MDDHNHCHEQSGDMGKGRSTLEDNGIADIDVASVALRLDAYTKPYVSNMANRGAKRDGRMATDVVKVTEAHGGRYICMLSLGRGGTREGRSGERDVVDSRPRTGAGARVLMGIRTGQKRGSQIN